MNNFQRQLCCTTGVVLAVPMAWFGPWYVAAFAAVNLVLLFLYAVADGYVRFGRPA